MDLLVFNRSSAIATTNSLHVSCSMFHGASMLVYTCRCMPACKTVMMQLAKQLWSVYNLYIPNLCNMCTYACICTSDSSTALLSIGLVADFCGIVL